MSMAVKEEQFEGLRGYGMARQNEKIDLALETYMRQTGQLEKLIE
jgi:hypothetical protein